ncbi:MAG: glycosyltransferase [Anaerolineales bacterium]|nr:glycosyltransferase [Anaerolineales bacterium]
MLRKFIDFFKYRFPGFFRAVIRLRDFFLIRIPGRLNIFRIRKIDSGISVFYLTTNFPNRPAQRGEHAHGGSVKLTYLAEVFPHAFPTANLAYIVTSVGHPMQDEILAHTKRIGLKFVINHDGVAFPAWAGNQYIEFNRISKNILDQADFIVYQSRFSKLSADMYLSPPNVPQEIIYNPVDLRHFSPQVITKPKELTLLLGGNQYEKYRLQLALKTLQSLLVHVPNARLIVTGTLWLPYREAEEWTARTLKEMNLTDHVTFVGTYTQAEAPLLFSRAHLLIHTKYADPCPGLVAEVLGCGLPVVYVENGGVPELVEEAGVGVSVEHSWETINLPDPEKMAEAVIRVYENLSDYSQVARLQAQKFSLEAFVAKHRQIFNKVLD